MDAKTQKIVDIFTEINKIPRKSKNEEKISKWLVEWGKSHGFESKQDEALNVYIYVPASKGREKDPIIAMQGHMDMVCEKTPDSTHDFAKDSIKNIIEPDGWMHADKTTLGADNGIGIALGLALASDESVSHPPLELLITTDEETGLNGANTLHSDYIKGRILLNLDSEDEGVFTIGCAGGKDAKISLNLKKDASVKTDVCYKIAVDGLKGGHSGVDINQPKENANILLTRVLKYISAAGCTIQLCDIAGGSAHNAIPRNAYATIYVPAADRNSAKQAFTKAATRLESLVKSYEPDVKISLTECNQQIPVYTKEDTIKVITLFNALPHGVAKMSVDMPGLVETSNNFATIKLENDVLSVLLSQRSSAEVQIEWITSRIESVAALAGATCKASDGYPGWQPNVNSPILALCKKTYTEMFKKEPHVEAIHAGLECGIIGAKFDGKIDMISLGPTVKNPHSPQEKMYIPSLVKIWDFMVALLKSIK